MKNDFVDYSESLKHYGVLGMKWGVRKDPNYRYTSHATKAYSKKADKFSRKASNTTDADKKKKYISKAQLNSKKAKASQTLDDRMLDNVKKTGVATTAYAIASLGGGPSKTYQTFKAASDEYKPAKDRKSNQMDADSVSRAYLVSYGSSLVGSTLGGAAGGSVATMALVAGLATNPATAAGAAAITAMVAYGGITAGRAGTQAAARKAVRNSYVKKHAK